MSPALRATLALLVALALPGAAPRALAQACAVSGSHLSVRSVSVDAGGSRFVVDVDAMDVEATPPRAARARTAVEVRGAVHFAGSVDPSELSYIVREGVEAGGGVLRIATRLPFRVESVRASAGQIVASLSDGDVRFADVALPCDALALDSPAQRSAFRDAFRDGVARSSGQRCEAEHASLRRAADEGARAREHAPEARAYSRTLLDPPDDRTGYAMLRGARAFVRVSPERREGLRVSVRRRREVPFEVLERRPGWTRVRLGWHDGSELTGWIAARELVRWVPPPPETGLGNLGMFGYGSGGGTSGVAGPARIRVGAPIRVAPGGPVWASAQSSESFTVRYDSDGEWIEVYTIPGLRFASARSAWVAREDVTFGVSDARGLVLTQPTWGAFAETTFERVDEGSPAHAAGLRSGDRIVAVDGAPADPRVGLDQLRELFPRGMRLTIERGGRRMSIDLAVQRGCELEWGFRSGPHIPCCPW